MKGNIALLMFNKYLFAASLLFGSALFAEKPIVKIVSSYGVNLEEYSVFLKQHGVEEKIALSDLSEYGKGLVKDRSRWGRLVRKLGLDFPHKIAVEDDVCKIVFHNTNVRYSRNLMLQKLPKEKLVLFMWEPPNAVPKMYSKNLHAKFGRVYTWDDSLVDNEKYFKFNYPALRSMIDGVVPFEEKKLCTLVASKIRPKYENSLYGERLKAIEYFENAGEEGFEFYGKGWEGCPFKSYRGRVADKTAAVKNYRFSICYENTAGLKGYITEKIFDCFAAGNVPVYWGAGNIADYVPKECFIDRRDFATMEELHAYLKNMSKEEYEGYIARIREFLLSEKAQAFSAAQFCKVFRAAVQS